MNKSIAIIIPARFASTRFPGKPLADLLGKSVIRWTWEKACSVLPDVYVATDDQRIFNHVSSFGKAIMTSPDHPSGTDRIREALEKTGREYDYVINVQGDEPLIDPAQIRELADLLDGEVQIATQAGLIHNRNELDNPHVVKVVFTKNSNALYFSRFGIPFERSGGERKVYKHFGIYAYRVDVLKEITELPVSSLEASESLEQLRWLENGYRIRVGVTLYESVGIDTPQDLKRAVEILSTE